jgi:hypothetical protein
MTKGSSALFLDMKVILASLCGEPNRAQVVAQSRNALIGIWCGG